MTSPRPNYGDALDHERILNIFFYTSNAIKLLQARLLFMRHGYTLRHFSGTREPYDENYELDTKELLKRAIQQVNEQFGVRSSFFVEDTSLRIDGLSANGDYPGLAVKEWFPETSFDDLDRLLKSKGNNRRATIFSDIALYIPTLRRPIFFHGETSGIIAGSSPEFEGSVQYPWLTPNTFNGWFVPDGAKKRLGEMEFEESLEFDFRAKSIKALLARIEEYNAILDLRPNFYTIRRAGLPQGQLSLLPEQARLVLLVIGDKCAGKTTFSDHVLATYEDVSVYEASTVLRGIAEEEGVIPTSSDEALAFLGAKGWDAVAAKIAQYIDKSDTRWNVITGLRTPEELLLLKERFPDAQIVLVNADPRIRFERHIRRARDQDIKTFEAFRNQDEKQRQFGVLRVASELADETITNDSTIEQYHAKIGTLLDQITKKTTSRPRKMRQLSELHRCLAALNKIAKAASCEQIAEETTRFGTAVRIYNTNRALKEVPEFSTRIEKSESLLQYRITRRGKTLLKLLNLSKGAAEPSAQSHLLL